MIRECCKSSVVVGTVADITKLISLVLDMVKYSIIYCLCAATSLQNATLVKTFDFILNKCVFPLLCSVTFGKLCHPAFSR